MSSTTETLLHEAALGPVPSYGTLPARANTRYPEGAIVCRDENGRAYNPTDADASGYPAVGTNKSYFLNGTNDRALGGGGTGLDDGLDIEVDYGPKGFAYTGTAPIPGDDMFVVDNQTISTDSNNGTRGFAGKCFEVRTTQGLAKAYITMGPGLMRGTGASAEKDIPLASFVDADGDPLAKFADGASAVPGFNLADSEAFGIRWNNHANPAVILTQTGLPADLDESRPATLEIVASKVGATVGDAVTFLVDAYLLAVGNLHDADANAGGTSSAMVGDAATKTTQRCTRTLAAADIPAGAATMTLTIKPTDGTLGTDDVIIHSVKLRYTRKY